MLTNDKNFRFKQIPDKTDEMIFLESPENLFLDNPNHPIWENLC